MLVALIYYTATLSIGGGSSLKLGGLTTQEGNFHLKVGGAKSSGNAGDPMLGFAVSGE